MSEKGSLFCPLCFMLSRYFFGFLFNFVLLLFRICAMFTLACIPVRTTKKKKHLSFFKSIFLSASFILIISPVKHRFRFRCLRYNLFSVTYLSIFPCCFFIISNIYLFSCSLFLFPLSYVGTDFEPIQKIDIFTTTEQKAESRKGKGGIIFTPDN